MCGMASGSARPRMRAGLSLERRCSGTAGLWMGRGARMHGVGGAALNVGASYSLTALEVVGATALESPLCRVPIPQRRIGRNRIAMVRMQLRKFWSCILDAV